MGILDRSESRRGAQVIWLAVHSTEGDDDPRADDARALRDATWWTGSSHAIADDEPGTLLTPAEGCVPYDLAAWTIRGGNRYSDNIELVARASWSRVMWLANPRLLDFCARWLADRHKARPWIPLVKLTPADVAARRPGVIGHADYTNGTGDGSHWDPGPAFPWDVVIDKARAYAAGSSGEDELMGAREDILNEVRGEAKAVRRYVEDAVVKRLGKLYLPLQLLGVKGSTRRWLLTSASYEEVGPERLKAFRADGVLELEVSQVTHDELRRIYGDPAA